MINAWHKVRTQYITYIQQQTRDIARIQGVWSTNKSAQWINHV